MIYNWEFKHTGPSNKIMTIQKTMNVNPIIAKLLINFNLDTKEKIEKAEVNDQESESIYIKLSLKGLLKAPLQMDIRFNKLERPDLFFQMDPNKSLEKIELLNEKWN